LLVIHSTKWIEYKSHYVYNRHTGLGDFNPHITLWNNCVHLILCGLYCHSIHIGKFRCGIYLVKGYFWFESHCTRFKGLCQDWVSLSHCTWISGLYGRFKEHCGRGYLQQIWILGQFWKQPYSMILGRILLSKKGTMTEFSRYKLNNIFPWKNIF